MPPHAKKSKPAAPSRDSRNALKLAEHYLSNQYLPYHQGIWTLYIEQPTTHWISINKFARYNGMSSFRARGVDWLVEVLRGSSGFLEVDEHGEHVRRKPMLPGYRGQLQRTVHAAGFGGQIDHPQLVQFFSQYGRVSSVEMCYAENGVFEDRVFCEFTHEFPAASFLGAAPSPCWKDSVLSICSKLDYCEEKMKQNGIRTRSVMARFCEELKVAIPDRYIIDEIRKRLPADEKGELETNIGTEYHMDFCAATITVKSDGTLNAEDVKWEEGCALKFTSEQNAAGPTVEWNASWNTSNISLLPYFPLISHIKAIEHNQGVVGFSRPLTQDDVGLVGREIRELCRQKVAWARASPEEEKSLMVEWAGKEAKRLAAELGRPSKKERLESASGDVGGGGGIAWIRERKMKRKAVKARRKETRRRNKHIRELKKLRRAETGFGQ
ncbi:hypothetical protein BOTBODRAFT_182631 [Botryobasidium botryosum FD-172 SS1]|uniref:HTH La-type RNA-binding domain-containing protein n=1 Tax=Botryobasidium botryosum (strain FD-172 SS1) TaxID=930990 RepID=A0A067N2Q2_BOTB1|nr:hypothetical protein BOTBODRAFT_182631 [Botryobasidium botryosum FD-172 SS1]